MKQKHTFEERLPLLLAFLLPILVMLGVFAGKGIFPFGTRSFLRTDLYHQYIAFYQNFAERLKEGQSLTYAFDIGLGSNFSALFAYYLCGPMQFLAILIPARFMIEFITYLIVLKIGLCGFAMAWYLSRHYNTRHIGITFCGICYALSGYLAAYSWNIMWLDVLWLAPIILYGLELLVKENKPFLYCVTLALAIFCNYYISIMLCIFLVFYFIAQMVLVPWKGWKQFLLKLFNFGFFSLLAGLLACVLVLPCYFALKTTASANSTFPKTIQNYFSILEMIARHLAVVNVEIGLDHWPNLYSGAAVFLFVPLYYLNKDVSYKEKITNSCLLAFMYLSFNTNMLNYIWHGMHYPNSLPCRQSFLYTFLVMSMCFEGIRSIRKQTKAHVMGVMWGAVILILLMEVIMDPEEIPYYACYASIGFILLYSLFIYLYKSRHIHKLTAIAMCMCSLIVEQGLNTAVTSVTTVDRVDFTRYDESYDKLIALAEKDKLFTRIERQQIRTKNDGPYFGYSSASIFSSTTNAAVTTLYKKLGMEGNTNAYSYTGATPLVSSLLSVEYIISEKVLEESPLYTLIAREADTKKGSSYLYRNNYTLPLGFLVPDDTREHWSYTNGSPIKVQNSFINVTTGLNNVLTAATSKVSGSSLEATVEKDGYYVATIGSSIKKVTAYRNDTSKVWDNVNRGYLVNFGYCLAGDELRITTSDSGTFSAQLYYFDSDLFIEAYNSLSQHPFQLTEYTNTVSATRMAGTVTADTHSTLLFSIPYENGWTVTVDGVPTETTALGNALLSVDVEAGSHTVVLTYVPEGLKSGAIVSLAALLLLILSFILSKLLERLNNSPEGNSPEGSSHTGRDRMALMHERDELDRLREEEKALLTEAASPDTSLSQAPAQEPNTEEVQIQIALTELERPNPRSIVFEDDSVSISSSDEPQN